MRDLPSFNWYPTGTPHIAPDAEPYINADELLSELNVVHHSLHVNESAQLARGRLRHLRRAVKVFGFCLAPIDLRQNSDVHEVVVAELLAPPRRARTILALNEQQRVALLLQELSTARPLASDHVPYSDITCSELAIFRAAKAAHQRYGTGAVQNCIISKAASCFRRARSRCAAQRGRVAAPARQRAGRQYHSVVRDDRGSAQ